MSGALAPGSWAFQWGCHLEPFGFGYSDAYVRARGSWIIGVANSQSQSPSTGWMAHGGVMENHVGDFLANLGRAHEVATTTAATALTNLATSGRAHACAPTDLKFERPVLDSKTPETSGGALS